MSSKSDESLLSSADESDYRRESRKRKRKDRHKEEHHRKKSKKKKRKHRKRDSKYESSDDVYSSSSSSSRSSSQDRNRKRRKKDKKRKERKKEKKRKHKRHHKDKDIETSSQNGLERNYALADALCNLFERHPALAGDLPIMLIRLATGTTFNLSQMTDVSAAMGLAKVFECLQSFGMTIHDGSWMWKNPDMGSGATRNTQHELFLVRLVRTLLDQIGFTIEALDEFERTPKAAEDTITADPNENSVKANNERIERQVLSILKTFRDGEMSKELAGLCQMIVEGEVVQLDGLPDERLRESLEALFTACGLEKSEMATDSDDDDNYEGEAETSWGYGLPETNDDVVKSALANIQELCRQNQSVVVNRPIKGPMPNFDSNKGQSNIAVGEESSSDDDDEGPLRFGETRKEPSLSKEEVKARAALRAKELECTKQGIKMNIADGNAREEWMLVPGKFDFLGAIKSGQPIRNRQFEGKKKSGESSTIEKVVDPKIQAEIMSIRQAHEESRGPSLMEQHREKKAAEAAAKQKQSAEWKWNRERDLDSGRRVDKDALNMILGGAGTDLKNKFHTTM